MKCIKSLFFALFACFSLASFAQTQTFSFTEFEAKPNSQNALMELFDSYYGAVTFKSGGVQLERLSAGDGTSDNFNFTHRIVWFGDNDNWGLTDDSKSVDKRTAFWRGISQYVENWGPSVRGRVEIWDDKGIEDHKRAVIWDFTPEDMVKYKSALDALHESTGFFGNRIVGFGTYDIGHPKAASHWYVATGKNVGDLIRFMDELGGKYGTAMKTYKANRGVVNFHGNFEVQILRVYN